MIGEAGWSTVLPAWLLDRFLTSIHIEGMAKDIKAQPRQIARQAQSL